MRSVDAVRAVLGAALVLQPAVPVRLLGTEPTAASDAAGRVLGARLLLQSAAGVAASRRDRAVRRRVGAADAIVEALHAASMVALVGVSRRWARPAAVSAAVASAFAVADLRSRAGEQR